MKNSDMKVIAIILSIALFFTIITSNAVSVASVILLAKDGVSTEAPAGDQGGATQQGGTVQQGGTTSTTPGGSTSTTPSGSTSTTPSGSTSTTPSGSTSTTPSGSTSTNDAGADDNAIMKDPLAAYQKAVKEITDNGNVNYNKKAWQTIEGDGLSLAAESSLVNALLGALKGTLTDLIKGFMTEESAAEDRATESVDDSKNWMPASNCKPSECKATAVKDGDNYVVTIVMNDQINPAKSDASGLRVMSKDILYMEDVVDTIQNDDTVSAVVKELKVGEINYKAYTIKAVMTADGKLVSIDHDCIADLKATIDAVGIGVVMGSGQLGFHTRYTNFKY